MIGSTTNFGWETDSETELFFLGRKFVVGNKPGHAPFAYQEDVNRIYKYVGEARKQADIVIFALHDQSHGLGVYPYTAKFAHGLIDNGAVVYFCNAGEHRGLELYKGKALIYRQPSLFFLTDRGGDPRAQLVHARVGASTDQLAGDFLDARAKAAAEGWAHGPGAPELQRSRGTAGHVCIIDHQFALKKIRIQPLEPSGGPRFRRGLPLRPDPESPLSQKVLNYSIKVSKPFGTLVETYKGQGINSVKRPAEPTSRICKLLVRAMNRTTPATARQATACSS